jgi:hypothetical protein
VEGEDALFDGVGGDEAVDGDGAVLADAVCAVGGLLFDGGVPPGVEEDDVVGGGEVEAEAAGLEGDEEEVALAALEGVDEAFAFGGGGGAVEVEVWEGGGVEGAADDGEEVGELGEYEGAVSVFAEVGEEVEEGVELGGGGLRLGAEDEGWVAAVAAESGELGEDGDAVLCGVALKGVKGGGGRGGERCPPRGRGATFGGRRRRRGSRATETERLRAPGAASRTGRPGRELGTRRWGDSWTWRRSYSWRMGKKQGF